MAVLEKIRVKMGVFITVLIGIALLSFIIDAETLQSAISMVSSKYDVGEMNGKKISYQDFQKKAEYYTQIHQITTNSSTMDEQTQEMVNQGAWQDFVSENVLIPAVKNAGIYVGEEEMYDLSQGAVISPVLAREQAFAGANGQFDKSKLVEFIKGIPQDNTGNLGTYWNYLEKNMMNEQMFTKYISLLAKSNINNPVQVRRSIEENNVTSDVSFVIQPYGMTDDTTIVVSKQEVKDYYNKQKKNFEQKASRDIEYAVLAVTPSADDIKLTETDIRKSYDEFVSTPNLKAFLAKNSDKPLDTRFYKAGELSSISPILDSFAMKANMSAVLPVYQEGSVFRAARVNAVKQLSDSVNVQHILIQNQDKVAAKKLADSLVAVIEKGGNFNELASAYSADKNPNAVPGELGWMTQSYQIPGFDTCFVAAVNKCFTVSTTYGLHIVRVKEKTKVVTKVQLAVFEKNAIAGKQTYQSFYSKANDLVSKSQGKYENFNSALKELNLVSVPATGIVEGSKTVATYKNAREISKWAFEAKKGDVSQIIAIDNKFFFVVALTGVHEEGIAPLEEVQGQITSVLRREKAIAKMLAKAKEDVKGISNLDGVAAKLGGAVSKQTGISFGAVGSQSFDPKFIGSICGAKENVLTGPIAGSVGIYIFNVDARQTGAFYTEDDAKKRATQMFSYQIQLLPMIMEKNAQVKDNRAKFF